MVSTGEEQREEEASTCRAGEDEMMVSSMLIDVTFLAQQVHQALMIDEQQGARSSSLLTTHPRS